MTMPDEGRDFLLPFQLDDLGLRGRIVRLGSVADRVVAAHGYPEPVGTLLSQSLALAAAIGGGVEQHLIALGFLAHPKEREAAGGRLLEAGGEGGAAPHTPLRRFPQCGQAAPGRQEGCDSFDSCGESTGR